MDVLGLLLSGNSVLEHALKEEEVQQSSVRDLARGRNPFSEDVDGGLFEIGPFGDRVLAQNRNIRTATGLTLPPDADEDGVGEPTLRLLLLLQEQSRMVEEVKGDKKKRQSLSNMLMAMPSEHFWGTKIEPLADASLYSGAEGGSEAASVDAAATDAAKDEAAGKDPSCEQQETKATGAESALGESADAATGGKTKVEGGGVLEIPAVQVEASPATVEGGEAVGAKEDDEKILVEKGGKFVLIDADGVTSASSGISDLTLEKSSHPSRRPMGRAKSARARPPSARPPSGRPARPKSAINPSGTSPKPKPIIMHSPGFKDIGSTRSMHTFASEDARDAFEAWVRRKKQDQQATLSRKQLDRENNVSREEKAKVNREVFLSWVERKEQDRKEKLRLKREQTRQEEERNRRKQQTDDSFFRTWVSEKSREAAARRKEERIRKQLAMEHEESLSAQEEQAQRAVQEWKARKRREKQAEQEEFQRRQRQYRRDARQIKARLQAPQISRYHESTLETHRPAYESARVRREARAREHAKTVSVTLHKLS